MNKRLRNFITVVLVFLVILTFYVPALALNNMKGHWAEAEINEWITKGLISGYEDGTFKPDNPITRAEFICLINRSFAFSEISENPYRDVSAKDWFYVDILKAEAAGYIGGYSDKSIHPNNSITRQEVAAIISKLLKLQPLNQQLSPLTDAAVIPEWSKGAIGSVIDKGYMRGYVDGTFKPHQNITRAEAIVTLNRVKADKNTIMYSEAGIFGPESGKEIIAGDVIISASNVTLQNLVVEGNLTISESVGDGEVTLKGITVKGDTFVKGGGENSIHFEDSVLVNVYVNKMDGSVRVVASGKTIVTQIKLETPAIVEQVDGDTAAFKMVTLEEALPANSRVTLIGDFETVEVKATTLAVEIPRGSIQDLNVSEKAKNSTIKLAKEAKVVSLVIDAVIKFIGEGQIENATIYVNGVSFEHKPANTEYGSGIIPISHSSGSGGDGDGEDQGNLGGAPKEFAGGTGTAQNPYQITEPRHLDNVRKYSDKYYILKNDIDMTTYLSKDGPGYNNGAGWSPIEQGEYWDPAGRTMRLDFFRGVFDGNGKKIIGLKMNREHGLGSSGLFAETSHNAVIQNLGLVNVDIVGTFNTGVIVGRNGGSISNCFSTGSLKGRAGGGGLVGLNVGSITNSYSKVDGDSRFGGLAWENTGNITNSYSNGIYGGMLSGLVGWGGYNYGVINNSYFNKDKSESPYYGNGPAKTTAEMKQQTTYKDWDFDNIWGINPNENDGYPFLRWQGFNHTSMIAELISVFSQSDHTPGNQSGADAAHAITWDISVPNNIDALTLLNIMADKKFWVYTDGAFLNQMPENSLHLPIGITTVFIKVMAEDNATVKFFAVNIYRQEAPGQAIFSKEIATFDFATVYDTQAQITSKPITNTNFGANPKSFIVTADEITIDVNLNWDIPLNGLTSGEVVGSAVDSVIQQYYNDHGLDLGMRTFTAVGYGKTFSISRFQTGPENRITVGGKDWSYFFEQNSASGTNTDTSRNRIFTISDGTNKASILLNRDYKEINNLVETINKELQNTHVQAFATGVNEQEFKLVPREKDIKLTVGGKNKLQFFTDTNPYLITIADPVGGQANIIADKETATAGDGVTVTIENIEEGKFFESITVTGSENGNIDIIEVEKGEIYSFTMPAEEVTVTVKVKLPSPIDQGAIVGITVPAAGEEPVANIMETDQYSGTVTWTPSDSPFDYNTIYTANITLTAKPGYTLIGVPAKYFTVEGATAVNFENSGVVTAVFPKTVPYPIELISILGRTDTTPGGQSGENVTDAVAWEVSVPNKSDAITQIDIAVSPHMTINLYSDANFSQEITDGNRLPLAVGKTTLYIKVTAEDNSAAKYYEVTVTRQELPKLELTSNEITNFDFSTIYGTQAKLTSKAITDTNFVSNPKNFTLTDGDITVDINFNWDVPLNGFTAGQVVGSVVDSYIQQYYNDHNLDLMQRTMTSVGFDDTFSISRFETGSTNGITLGGNDWSYFFDQNSAYGTDTDSSRNREFTISDGTNTAMIVLDLDFGDMEGLVRYINLYLQEAEVNAMAEKVDNLKFRFVTDDLDFGLTLGGKNYSEFFTE